MGRGWTMDMFEKEAAERLLLSPENAEKFISNLFAEHPQMEDAMSDADDGMPLRALKEKYPHLKITEDMIEESERHFGEKLEGD